MTTMRLTSNEFRHLKQWKTTTPQLPTIKRTKTIGELIEAACPEPEVEQLLPYEQARALNTFALQVSSLEEWHKWLREQGFE